MLDSKEQKEYKSKMAKSVYSLMASLLWIPYVGFQLVTFRNGKGDMEAKRARLRGSMILQIIFSVMNYSWSNQFFKYE
jgi:hypothetical protein